MRILLMLLALLVSHAAAAQAWPNRPVRFLVPFAAGAGINDIMARLVGQHLGAGLGQPVVIDNRAGRGRQSSAPRPSAKAAPDGYTLLMANGSLVVEPLSLSKLPYDPLKDFVPVTLVATSPLLLVVHPSVPAKSVQELIALRQGESRQAQLRLRRRRQHAAPRRRAVQVARRASTSCTCPTRAARPALDDLIGGPDLVHDREHARHDAVR